MEYRTKGMPDSKNQNAMIAVGVSRLTAAETWTNAKRGRYIIHPAGKNLNEWGHHYAATGTYADSNIRPGEYVYVLFVYSTSSLARPGDKFLIHAKSSYLQTLIHRQ